MTTRTTPAEILRERADALAEEPAGSGAEPGGIEVVEFRLGRERYGMPLSAVREVNLLQHFTPVPSTPVWVLGLINLRGAIVAVIDLRHLFDLPGRGLSDLNHVLVVHAAGMDLGILADEIVNTHIVPPSQLQPPKPAFGGLWEEHITGVTGDGVTVLNPARLFADPALLVRHKPFTARHA